MNIIYFVNLGLRQEVNDLMVICDMDKHNDSEIQSDKHKMISDLIELGEWDFITSFFYLKYDLPIYL